MIANRAGFEWLQKQSVGIAKRARRGFTLTEMLVVIAIILVITLAALPAIIPALESRHLRESARIIQAVISGARDRSLAQGSSRGIRLLPNPDLPGTFNRLRYIESPPPYTQGVVAAAISTDSNTGATVSGFMGVGNPFPQDPGTNWQQSLLAGSKIRINQSGPLYNVVGWAKQTGTTTFYFSNGSPYDQSFEPPTIIPFVAVRSQGPGGTFIDGARIPTPVTGMPYKLYPAPQPLEGSREELLPGGVVIDNRLMPVGPAAPPTTLPQSPNSPGSLSFNNPSGTPPGLPTNPDGSVDFVFGSNGQVTGSLGASQGLIILWVGEATPSLAAGVSGYQSAFDVAANATKAFLMTISTRTGEVRTVDINPDTTGYTNGNNQSTYPLQLYSNARTVTETGS